MKKILLATTFLVATTGFAAAEISFAGSSAKMGIAREGGTAAIEPSTDATAIAEATALRDEAQAVYDAADAAIGDELTSSELEALTAAGDDLEDAQATLDVLTGGAPSTGNGDFETYSSVELVVAFSGETDNGLTFGADFAVTIGRSYTLADDDGFADEGGAFGMPTVWIDGAYGRISISDDNFDFFDDAHADGDIKYEGTFGAIAVGLIADIDASEYSAKAAYTAGNLAASFNVDTYEVWNVEASYTFNAITATVATDEAAESSVKLAYSSGPITASAKYNTVDDSVDLAAGFVNNGMSFDAEYNTVTQSYTVTTGFDLGGGLSLEAGTNYTGDVMIGAKMEF